MASMRKKTFTSLRDAISDLLDRYEASPGSSRLMATMAFDQLASVRQCDRLNKDLEAAERQGIVKLYPVGERGQRKIKLLDADAAYKYLGRAPAVNIASSVVKKLHAAPQAGRFKEVIDKLEESWGRGKRSSIKRMPALNVDDVDSIVAAMAMADSILNNSDQIDYRTLSTSAGQDSKALERHKGLVVGILRNVEDLPEDADADDVLSLFGVEKMAQPIMMSANLVNPGDVSGCPYIGVPPEHLSEIKLPDADYILTIENWVSFVLYAQNVNAAKNGIVLFTGGFPSRSWRLGYQSILRQVDAPVFHWGDVDPGGLYISDLLSRLVEAEGRQLRLHLMTPELSNKKGSALDEPVRPGQSNNPDVARLWEYLSQSGAHKLEQEEIIPKPPCFK